MCFSHCKYMGANDPARGYFVNPGVWLAGFIDYLYLFYVEHQTSGKHVHVMYTPLNPTFI